MCLIALAWQVDARWPLVVAANRDEFHSRPTAAAHWWSAPAGLFAGADLQAGGAWCGVDRCGRFAAVTNVRAPAEASAAKQSRGLLVRDFFASGSSAADWAAQVRATGERFNPFNLLVGDGRELWFVSNRGAVDCKRLRSGIVAVSNGHWGEHWPKTQRAERELERCMASGEPTPDALFALLADTDVAPVKALPDTGVGVDRERFLSPVFIRSAAYGTRASTVIRRNADARIDFHERGFDAGGRIIDQVDEHWLVQE